MSPNESRGRSSGFSLLELIAVLVVLGLASALAAPRIQGSLDEAKIRTATRKMATLLRYARNQALVTKQVVTVASDQAGERWSLHYSELPAKEKSLSLPQGIRGKIIERYLSLAPEASGKILFFPRGNSTGQMVEIYDGRGRKFLLAIDPIVGNTSLSPRS